MKFKGECNQCFMFGIGCIGSEDKTIVRVNGVNVATIEGSIPGCVVLRQEKSANHFIGAMLSRASKQTPLSVERQIEDSMFDCLRPRSSLQGL